MTLIPERKLSKLAWRSDYHVWGVFDKLCCGVKHMLSVSFGMGASSDEIGEVILSRQHLEHRGPARMPTTLVNKRYWPAVSSRRPILDGQMSAANSTWPVAGGQSQGASRRGPVIGGNSREAGVGGQKRAAGGLRARMGGKLWAASSRRFAVGGQYQAASSRRAIASAQKAEAVDKVLVVLSIEFGPTLANLAGDERSWGDVGRSWPEMSACMVAICPGLAPERLLAHTTQTPQYTENQVACARKGAARAPPDAACGRAAVMPLTRLYMFESCLLVL